MPNRIVREAILDSDRYNALTHDSERLLFLEMILLADDYGLLPSGYGFLRRRTSVCRDKTPAQVANIISALQNEDLIRIYEDKDQRYAYIPRFKNVPRNLKPRWPLPVDNLSRKEINDLLEKRISIAYKRTANVSETVTGTGTGTFTETKIKNKSPCGAELFVGIDPEIARDFKALREKKRAAITHTAIKGIDREAKKAGISLQDALRICCERAWISFKAEWMERETPNSGKTALQLIQESEAKREEDRIAKL